MKKAIRIIFIVLLLSVLYFAVIDYKRDTLDGSNLSNLGVDTIQIQSLVTIVDTEYLIYQRNSLNIPLEGDFSESGVLYRKVGEKDYKKLVGVVDKEGGSVAKNNVYKVWEADGKIRIMIVDHLGAGSGEGMAKVLASSDGGEIWIPETCFYFVPERWDDQLMLVGEEVSVNTPECANFEITKGDLGKQN